MPTAGSASSSQQVGDYFPNPLVTKHFTHDLWNQLVKVAYQPYQSSSVTRAEYRYNALNWRIQKTADIGPNGVPDGTLDQRRDMYYSANWQMLEEYINDDIVGQLGPNRRTQYIWGPRYIDDIVMRRQDNNADGDFIDAGDKVYVHCTDAQFSTVAVLEGKGGRIVEQVQYDEYGKARLIDHNDLNGDGAVTSADDTIRAGNAPSSCPLPGDVNRDGVINKSDSASIQAAIGINYAFGKLSVTDNTIGWCGYVFNEETGNYKVRFRDYIVDWGRWVERDRAGFVDGMNLFEVAQSSPVLRLDPSGLMGIMNSPMMNQNWRGYGCTLASCCTHELYLQLAQMACEALAQRDDALHTQTIWDTYARDCGESRFFSLMESLAHQRQLEAEQKIDNITRRLTELHCDKLEPFVLGDFEGSLRPGNDARYACALLQARANFQSCGLSSTLDLELLLIAPISGCLRAGSITIAEEACASRVSLGTRLTRVWGGESGPFGKSWTRLPVSQQSRELLGIECNNTGEFVMHGTVTDCNGVCARKALAWGRFRGTGDEVVIPCPQSQVRFDACTMPDIPIKWR